MDIQGTYKISIEMSARKQVNGLLSTSQRLLDFVGIQETFEPEGKEEHIQKVINLFKENQEIVDAVTMKIGEDAITVSTDEGEMTYSIKKKIPKEGDGQIRLELDCDEFGPTVWDVTLAGNYFLFDSEDELSEYVYEKQVD